MAWYRIAENVLTAMANAINAKTGKTAPLTPVEMVAEIQDMPSGGGELFYTPQGAAYAAHLEIPLQSPPLDGAYQNATNLESVRTYGNDVNQTASVVSLFAGCTKLSSATIENLTKFGHYVFRDCHALRTVVLGKVGIPVSALASLSFYNCNQSDLTITIYVNDDATLPLTGSPWSATNATIIYRSATTGEVISV